MDPADDFSSDDELSSFQLFDVGIKRKGNARQAEKEQAALGDRRLGSNREGRSFVDTHSKGIVGSLILSGLVSGAILAYKRFWLKKEGGTETPKQHSPPPRSLTRKRDEGLADDGSSAYKSPSPSPSETALHPARKQARYETVDNSDKKAVKGTDADSEAGAIRKSAHGRDNGPEADGLEVEAGVEGALTEGAERKHKDHEQSNANAFRSGKEGEGRHSQLEDNSAPGEVNSGGALRSAGEIDTVHESSKSPPQSLKHEQDRVNSDSKALQDALPSDTQRLAEEQPEKLDNRMSDAGSTELQSGALQSSDLGAKNRSSSLKGGTSPREKGARMERKVSFVDGASPGEVEDSTLPQDLVAETPPDVDSLSSLPPEQSRADGDVTTSAPDEVAVDSKAAEPLDVAVLKSGDNARSEQGDSKDGEAAKKSGPARELDPRPSRAEVINALSQEYKPLPTRHSALTSDIDVLADLSSEYEEAGYGTPDGSKPKGKEEKQKPQEQGNIAGKKITAAGERDSQGKGGSKTPKESGDKQSDHLADTGSNISKQGSKQPDAEDEAIPRGSHNADGNAKASDQQEGAVPVASAFAEADHRSEAGKTGRASDEGERGVDEVVEKAGIQGVPASDASHTEGSEIGENEPGQGSGASKRGGGGKGSGRGKSGSSKKKKKRNK